MDNNCASSMERNNQEINTDTLIVSEMEEIWRRASDSNEIEALFQMLKSELLTNEEGNQTVDNNFANNGNLIFVIFFRNDVTSETKKKEQK